MSDLPNAKEFGAVFPTEEYDGWRERVRQRMVDRGVDLLYVSSPRNINYLTGYDSIWFYQATPTGVAIRSDRDDVIFFDSGGGHRRMIEEFSYVDDAVYFGWSSTPLDPADVIVDTLKDRGWLTGTVGIEMWSHNVSAALLNAIWDRVEASGGKPVDGSWIVEDVALAKSPMEIASMRKAAEIADIGMEAGRKTLRPGKTEIELMSEIHYAMGMAGGEDAALRTAVRGQSLRSMMHKPSTRYRLQAGETVFSDLCGVYNRYHSNLCRYFGLGEPTRATKERIETLAESLTAVIDAIRPGEPVTKVGDVMQEYIDSVGLTDKATRTGYSMGIAIPADWVGHAWLSHNRFVDAAFDVGVTMNYEIFSREDSTVQPVGFIDTLLMTENGLEVLAKTPQAVLVSHG